MFASLRHHIAAIDNVVGADVQAGKVVPLYQAQHHAPGHEGCLYRHIHLCLHPKNRIYVLAATYEAQLPPALSEILPKALQASFCDVLEELILSVAQVKKQKEAAMLAASVCACVQFYAVQPELTKCMFMAKTRHEPNYAEVEDMLNNMLLRSIVANTAINKAF